MNIFATDPNPVVSALALDDRRLNKMIVESAQMLSMALYRYDVHDPVLYKHVYSYSKHPCTLWAGRTRKNFEWLVMHALAMCEVYKKNNKKIHASEAVILKCWDYTHRIPKGELEQHPNCTDFKNAMYSHLTIYEKYKEYLNLKWSFRDKQKPKWTNRKIPNFYKGLPNG